MKSQNYTTVTHRGRYSLGEAGGTTAMPDPSLPPLSVELRWISFWYAELRRVGPASSSDPCVACPEWRCNKDVIKTSLARRVYQWSQQSCKNCQSTASKSSPCCPGCVAVRQPVNSAEMFALTAEQNRGRVEEEEEGVSINWSQCVLLQWMGWADVCISEHRTDSVMWILKRHFRRRHGLVVEMGTILLSSA